MRLKLSNIGCFEQFELALEPGVVLLTADNAQGKSTICQALAACLCRRQDPAARGLTRLNSYVKRGEPSETAVATVTGLDWEVSWSPVGGFSQRGEPPVVPSLALLDPPQKGRAEWLACLEPPPLTVEQLQVEIIKILGSEQSEQAQDYATAILLDQPKSWDVQHALFVERRSDAKTAWKAAVASVGEALEYGSQRAQNWVPAGWSIDLEAKSVAAITLEIENAREMLKNAKQLQAQHLASKTAYEKDQQRRAEIAKQIEELESRQQNLQAAATAAAATSDTPLQTALADSQQQIEQLREKQKRLTTKLERLNAEQSNVVAERDAAAKTVRDVKIEHSNRVQQAQRELEQARQRKAELEHAAESIQQQSDNCPTCGQPWAHLRLERDDAIAKNAQQLNAVESEITTRKAALAEREAAESVAVRRAQEHESAIVARDDDDTNTTERQAVASELDEIKNEIQRAIERQETANQALEQMSKTVRTRNFELGMIEGELKKLTEEAAQSPMALPTTDDSRELETALTDYEITIEQLQGELRLLNAKTAADKAHLRVGQYDALAQLTSDAMHGLRARRLNNEVDKANEWIAAVAPWCGVSISRGPVLRVHGTLISDAARSEQWAAIASLRLTIAALRDSPIVVLDGIDILTATHRPALLNKLQTAAERLKICVVVTQSVEGEKLC